MSHVEKKRPSRNVAKSDQHYRSFILDATDGYALIDAQNARFIDVNNALIELVGYGREELLEMRVLDIECVKNGESFIVRSVEKKQERFETIFRCRDGVLVDVDASARYSMEGEKIVAFFRDVTERRRTEELLKKGKAIRDLLIEALPYPSMLIRQDRTVLFANKVAREVGAVVNGLCWRDFGHSDYIFEEHKAYINDHKAPPPGGTHCTFCLANDALCENETKIAPSVHAFGRFWETYWIPVNEDTYLHFALDITERKMAREQIACALQEKEVLLREIHHRVKNNMQVIVSMLRMHSRRSRNEEVQKTFDECRDRISAMSLIHEALYESENASRIDFEPYLTKLCRYLSQAYGSRGRGISVTVEQRNVTLGMDQGVALGMVVCELVSNAFKHAYPVDGGGNVAVSISGLDGGEVELIVQDDGRGLPESIDIEDSPSLGLRLAVSAVTRELGGRIGVERDGGTRYRIRFEGKTFSESGAP